MPQEFLDRNDLGALLEYVRGKRLPETMATRGDPRGLGVALHLFLDRRAQQRPVGALLVPEDGDARHVCWPIGQTGLEMRHRIGGDVDPPIFPAFALVDADGLLRPVEIVQREVDHLRDAQTAPEHEQEQRLIHGGVDLGKQLPHLVQRQGLGQGAAPAHHVTRFDRVPCDTPLLKERVKEMFQRMQAPMERRGGEPLMVLLGNKPLRSIYRGL